VLSLVEEFKADLFELVSSSSSFFKQKSDYHREYTYAIQGLDLDDGISKK